MLKLKRNLLSVALGSAILTMATGVYAQEADQAKAAAPADDEAQADQKKEDKEVVLDSYEVTGIMRSIEQSVATDQLYGRWLTIQLRLR